MMKFKVGDFVNIRFKRRGRGNIPEHEHNIKGHHPSSLPGPYKILSFSTVLEHVEILIKTDDGEGFLKWWVNTSSLECPTPKTGNKEIDFLDMLHFNRWSL